MNKTSLLYLALIITPLFSANHNTAVNKDNQSGGIVSTGPLKTDQYVIDNKESVIQWKCSMVIADNGGHNGYVSLLKGDLMIGKGQLVGGTIDVDMSTIADELHGSSNNLIDHIKSADFFDVEKFPISTFAITKVEPTDFGDVNVTGKLTIKGITHEVTFPAKVEVKGRTVTANGKVNIDRTKWDVRYGSGKFFDNLADQTISDNIEFDIKIVARK